jgi:hypothetical protein
MTSSKTLAGQIRPLTGIMEKMLNYHSKVFAELPTYKEALAVSEELPKHEFVRRVARDVARLLEEDPINWNTQYQRLYLLVDMELLQHLYLPARVLLNCRRSVVQRRSILVKLVKSGIEPSRFEIATAVHNCLEQPGTTAAQKGI